MKERSYTELMKISAMNRHQANENFVQNLYIEMFLEEIQLISEKEKLLKQIDLAIDQRDKPSFCHLSKQYVELNKKFGS